jgi:hypothetical protein
MTPEQSFTVPNVVATHDELPPGIPHTSTGILIVGVTTLALVQVDASAVQLDTSDVGSPVASGSLQGSGSDKLPSRAPVGFYTPL